MMEIDKILKVKGSFEHFFKQAGFDIITSSVSFEGFDLTLLLPKVLDKQSNKIKTIYLNFELMSKSCQLEDAHFYYAGVDQDPIVKTINKKINNPEEILELVDFLKKAALKYSI